MICRFCEVELVVVGLEQFTFSFCPKCRLMYFQYPSTPVDTTRVRAEVSGWAQDKKEEEALAGLASLFG
jgi:Zn-finger nucleic acid-binding protein